MDQRVRAVLRHPVTLEPLDGLGDGEAYLDASVGAHTEKNRAELQFATEEYGEPDGRNYVERLPHMAHPEIAPEAIVVDIGCGPRSFLAGMGGRHVFVDDLIGAYISELGATYEGLAVNARSELLPFEDDSIDVVYSVNMLDHVDDLPETMFELHRVLSPSGVMVLQTYFNSHPLLPSEPGVVDRYAFDSLIEPYFVVENLRTHEVESPEINSYYTMGILTCQLRKREVKVPDRNRSRLTDPEYVAPQSAITECLAAIGSESFDVARRCIEALGGSEHYEFHQLLLEAKLATAKGRLADSASFLGRAQKHRRGRRNPYARIAIKELQIERLLRAVTLEASRTAEARAGIERRQRRIEELDAAILQRDRRVAQLERAVAIRGKELASLGRNPESSTPDTYDQRITAASERLTDIERRLRDRQL